MVYLVPFLSYFAGSKSISARPSDPDSMTITDLESTASSSGKNDKNDNNKNMRNDKNLPGKFGPSVINGGQLVVESTGQNAGDSKRCHVLL